MLIVNKTGMAVILSPVNFCMSMNINKYFKNNLTAQIGEYIYSSGCALLGKP